MSEQRLFISYANEDEAVVDRIVAYLEARGVPCWISSRDIPPRAIYADAITGAVQACSACAVVLSKASNQSKAVKRELELTSHYDKPFIPIRIDATEPAPGVDYYLRNTQWLDYKRDGARALDRIVAQVRGAPMPATAAQRRRMPVWPALVVGGLLLLGAGAWYASTQLGRGDEPSAEQAAVDPALLVPLLGSYNWDGVACGDGPTITQEGAALLFTMPGTPAYRHEVLSATTNTDGYALYLNTRVVGPDTNRDESYAIGIRADSRELDVRNGDGGIDHWTRCPQPTTTQLADREDVNAPTPLRDPPTNSIVGRWSVGTALQAFAADGTWANNSGGVGRWDQSGGTIRFWLSDDPEVLCVGSVDGDVMTYSCPRIQETPMDRVSHNGSPEPWWRDMAPR